MNVVEEPLIFSTLSGMRLNTEQSVVNWLEI